MNKKASALDVLLMAVLIFGFVLGFVIVHKAVNTTADLMMDNPEINSTDFVGVMEDTKALSNRLDYVAFAIFMGFIISLIITSFLVSGNPIFMFIFLVVDIIIVVVASVLSFVWNEVITKATFADQLTAFPIMNHILDKLPFYIGIIALLSLAIMYAKPYLVGEA